MSQSRRGSKAVLDDARDSNAVRPIHLRRRGAPGIALLLYARAARHPDEGRLCI